jgi:hypothetical protein
MSHESRSVGNAILKPCTVYEPWGEPISGSEATRCERTLAPDPAPVFNLQQSNDPYDMTWMFLNPSQIGS